MCKDIWDDDYSYLDDKDERDYEDYIERLEREEDEHDDWLRTRYAEPDDLDYDEFDSLTSVEEYIDEHRDELTNDEIRDLKDEYGIIDDEDDYDDFALLRISKFKPNYGKTIQNKPKQPPTQTKSTPSTNLEMHPAIIVILYIIGAIILAWAIVDLMSLLSVVALIVIIGFFIWLFKPIFK